MISIGNKDLTLSQCYDILFKGGKIDISQDCLENVFTNFNFLKDFSSNKLIYGINTGFGPMAQYKIEDSALNELQYNLIRSHCSGVGKLLTPTMAKALMLARLSSFSKGYSGIHTDLLVILTELINKDVTPCIFEHGGVGASGDLVQLAHLAYVLIGEGEVIYNGERRPAKDVFAQLNIKPLAVHLREGLALMNGTSAMTGIGIINVLQAQNLLGWSVAFSSVINELVEAYDDHFSHELNHVKKHAGQNKIAQVMRNFLHDSKRTRKREEHLYKETTENVFKDKVQEYYSIRCVPQILGPIYDTILAAESVVAGELNSVNDNPVIDHKIEHVYHGGNFHGDYISMEMDKLKMAVTKLAMLSERQLNYMVNDKLNQKFPPFVNLGTLGLNFGVQGMQFTATSTVAECQTLSYPMYLHSIPNNNDNQDIVSMGCNSALLTNRVIENAFEVLSIQFITILQTVDYLQCQDTLSSFGKEVYEAGRKVTTAFVADKPHYQEIQAVKDLLMTQSVEKFATANNTIFQ